MNANRVPRDCFSVSTVVTQHTLRSGEVAAKLQHHLPTG
ncbi:hypothetical protein JOM49_007046 [Amycolatopsis magusensis]|uniref:Uncharacterized protein n=1 Tax=Amycolatopsis magusensis TaxID=882444 RepID=A0ABS4Q1G5_9PSEU|nr:hypothetical protein [Amycolatopsis magusensis]